MSIKLRHFQWSWATSNQDFKVMPFFDAKYLRNGTRYRHSFNRILIGTYTSLLECHFKWPWWTLSNLAKYLMTWSIARSFCDSWASCLNKTLCDCTHFNNFTPYCVSCVLLKQFSFNWHISVTNASFTFPKSIFHILKVPLLIWPNLYYLAS